MQSPGNGEQQLVSSLYIDLYQVFIFLYLYQMYICIMCSFKHMLHGLSVITGSVLQGRQQMITVVVPIWEKEC